MGNNRQIQNKKKSIKWGLYHKFVLAILLLGLLPVIILSTGILNVVETEYEDSIQANYQQATAHIHSSIKNTVDTYNDISKMIYQYGYNAQETPDYGYSAFDNLRAMLYGEKLSGNDMETERRQEMEAFLRNLQSVDAYIYAAHFVGTDGEGNDLFFHYSSHSKFFRDEETFLETIAYDKLDKASSNLILIPPHQMMYYQSDKKVITIARNYFDIRGVVGKRSYVGTLFIDVDLNRLRYLLKTISIDSREDIYVLNDDNICFYSTENEMLGEQITVENWKQNPNLAVFETIPDDYGLKVIGVMDREQAFATIRNMQNMMYIFMIGIALLLIIGSVFFSKKLTGPIYQMMNKMSEIESGNFDIELPVERKDEIGILAGRFNQMSSELKNYINKSYVAQLKQNEAELTALKSQIYPHFLYNTLEIIRMTALDEEDNKVSDMIEALSRQIHYLIGPVKDMVPIEQEIDNVEKYVFLLNCRIAGKIQMHVNLSKVSHFMVPRLILQPIVENAYVHGIKPKTGSGTVMIETEVTENRLVISIMDNGVGMDEIALEKIRQLLVSNEIGIKDEYNWQSIGLKNVHDRIRYLYGDEFGIEITSTVSIGTMVRILLPETVVREEQADADDHS